jgi:NitT/TauT family transport system ATP-binding protein
MILKAIHVSKRYQTPRGQDEVFAIKDIDFEVKPGEFVSIVGPSGCGKTTLLYCISGLMKPSRGKILVDGTEVLKPPDNLLIVFQDYSKSLMPWRTVLGNVCYGLESTDIWPKSKIKQEAERYINMMQLNDFKNHFTWQLSGGMQQRVAIARALINEPEILLMDEPFGSLDAQTRSDLEDMLLDLWLNFSSTILFVTHDIDEAIYLSDRVIVLSRRPATVIENLSIQLERPRDQLRTRSEPLFLSYRSKIYQMIEREKERTTYEN